MIEVEVELSPEFKKQIALFDQYEKIADKHLTQAMQGSLIGIQGLARSNAPVFRGQLQNSISTSVKSVGPNIEGRVFSTIRSPYAYPLVMEFGRRPGKMPPPSALRRWVQLVIKPPGELVDGLAYIVARAIGRRGIKGRFFMKKAIESSKVRIGMLFREAVDRISKDMEVKS